MTRHRVRCGTCGGDPDFTEPTDPRCAGCMLHADNCTCARLTVRIDNPYEQWFDNQTRRELRQRVERDLRPEWAATTEKAAE